MRTSEIKRMEDAGIEMEHTEELPRDWYILYTFRCELNVIVLGKRRGDHAAEGRIERKDDK